MSPFVVGMNVVCINDDFSNWFKFQLSRTPNKPKQGCVYTIREVLFIKTQTKDNPEIKERLELLLEEIINPLAEFIDGKAENCFEVARFRPCQSTDLSELRSLLSPDNLKRSGITKEENPYDPRRIKARPLSVS